MADTESHALREVDLAARTVKTLAGGEACVLCLLCMLRQVAFLPCQGNAVASQDGVEDQDMRQPCREQGDLSGTQPSLSYLTRRQPYFLNV